MSVGVKTFADTVLMMLSDDYKKRFVAEYWQLRLRWEKLHKMNVKLEANTLPFNPECDKYVLSNQEGVMYEYMKILEIRAEIEGIDLGI